MTPTARLVDAALGAHIPLFLESAASLRRSSFFVVSLFVVSLFVVSLFVVSLFVVSFFVVSLFVVSFFVVSLFVVSLFVVTGFVAVDTGFVAVVVVGAVVDDDDSSHSNDPPQTCSEAFSNDGVVLHAAPPATSWIQIPSGLQTPSEQIIRLAVADTKSPFVEHF